MPIAERETLRAPTRPLIVNFSVEHKRNFKNARSDLDAADVPSYRPSLYEFHKIADDILRCKTEGRRYFCNITTICGHSWILESDTCTLRHSVFNFILRCFIMGSRNWKHHWKVQKNSRFLDKVVKSIDTQWQYYYFKMSV